MMTNNQTTTYPRIIIIKSPSLSSTKQTIPSSVKYLFKMIFYVKEKNLVMHFKISTVQSINIPHVSSVMLNGILRGITQIFWDVIGNKNSSLFFIHINENEERWIISVFCFYKKVHALLVIT